MRPLFRAMQSLCALEDSMQDDRIAAVMSTLLISMTNNKQYWRYIDVTADHLIRLAKKNPKILAYLRANESSWDWLIDWVKTNGVWAEQKDMTRVKNRHKMENLRYHQQWQTYSQTSTHTYYGLDAKSKEVCLDVIKNGSVLEDEHAEDSDEALQNRKFKVGDMIDCLDTDCKWFLAKVLRTTPSRVFVHYEGFKPKWDAWFHNASPHLAERGKFSDFEPK